MSQSQPNESEHFTVEEFEQAYRLIVDADEAKQLALEMKTPLEDEEPSSQPWSLSEDVLDLLSLVSDSCAQRVQRIWQSSDEAAAQRRQAMRARLDGDMAPPLDG